MTTSVFLRLITACDYGSRLALRFAGTTRASIQRRRLPHLDRAEIHRAVDEAQREGPRLLAFEHRFLAERVDAGGDADIGVLPHPHHRHTRASSPRAPP